MFEGFKSALFAITAGAFLTVLLACGCQSRHAPPTRESTASIEKTCQFLSECAQLRDWRTFYAALHPAVQSMIPRGKFVMGMKLRSKFTRLIRQAKFNHERVNGEHGSAFITYKDRQYEIYLRRDALGWKIYMDGDDLDRLEQKLKADLDTTTPATEHQSGH